ncbi:hypothetical protein EJ03DRAFT_324261 [Teratosphaeria nubilosa]|uniref:Uncharacterized protein n=1 Tax=Teratosphaeria nubilosa TaxID=161662 RepID=A0A6G1LID9_9PEZI|nr:hypothetical protein EJ03DRAFT_324261 [Teratosphaeria nubilosa]
MHGLLLPIVIFTAYATADGDALFQVWGGHCNSIGHGRGEIKFNPFPSKEWESSCYYVNNAPGSVIYFNKAPKDGFSCVGLVYDNGNCAGSNIGFLDGQDSERCKEVGGIYSMQVYCQT